MPVRTNGQPGTHDTCWSLVVVGDRNGLTNTVNTCNMYNEVAVIFI